MRRALLLRKEKQTFPGNPYCLHTIHFECQKLAITALTHSRRLKKNIKYLRAGDTNVSPAAQHAILLLNPKQKGVNLLCELKSTMNQDECKQGSE